MPSKIRRRFDSLVRRQRQFVCQIARILDEREWREQWHPAERVTLSQQQHTETQQHHDHAAAQTNWHSLNWRNFYSKRTLTSMQKKKFSSVHFLLFK